jgi:hypothetical protein
MYMAGMFKFLIWSTNAVPAVYRFSLYCLVQGLLLTKGARFVSSDLCFFLTLKEGFSP